MMRARRSTAPRIGLQLAFALVFGLAVRLDPAARAEPPPPAQAAALVDFDIPPEPLAQAIEQFAAATGLQVLYDRPVGAHLSSPGAHGRMSNAQALERLLAGTGLTARFSSTGDAVLAPIESAAAGPSAPGPPSNLPSLALAPLHVTAPFELEVTDDGAAAFRLYALLVRDDVHHALTRTPKLARDEFDASLDLWVSPAGVVQDVRLMTPSGHSERDALIQSAIRGLALDAPPPAGLPQPIHVSISARHP